MLAKSSAYAGCQIFNAFGSTDPLASWQSYDVYKEVMPELFESMSSTHAYELKNEAALAAFFHILDPHLSRLPVASHLDKSKAVPDLVLNLDPTSLQNLKNRFFEVYKELLQKNSSTRQLIAKRFSRKKSLEHLLEEKFAFELAFHGVKGQLESMGIVSESFRQRVVDLTQKNKNSIYVLLSSAINYKIIESGYLSAVFLPRIDFFHNYKIPDYLLARGLEDGFDSIKGDLAKVIKNRHATDFYYNNLVDAVNAVSLISLVMAIPELFEDDSEQDAELEKASKIVQDIKAVDSSPKYDWSSEAAAEKSLDLMWEAAKRHELSKGKAVDRTPSEWNERKQEFKRRLKEKGLPGAKADP